MMYSSINLINMVVISRIFMFLYFYLLIVGSICRRNLNKKTKFKKNQSLSNKLDWQFFFLNIFNYFILDKIKEKRKIEYMQNRINFFERMNSDFGPFNDEDYAEIRNYKLYLKINKLKTKTK